VIDEKKLIAALKRRKARHARDYRSAFDPEYKHRCLGAAYGIDDVIAIVERMAKKP
jgi:hypothetical protein